MAARGRVIVRVVPAQRSTAGGHKGPHSAQPCPRPYAKHGSVEKTYPCKPGRVPLKPRQGQGPWTPLQ